MKIKKNLLYTILLAAIPASAQLSNISLDEYQQYLGRKGLDIHAVGEGNLLYSAASGSVFTDPNGGADPLNPAIPTTYGQQRQEKLQTTNFDLDMKYRPLDWASAHVIMRFQQDWQSYFMARSRPISFLWSSIDGTRTEGPLGFYYNFGNIQDKESPLSVWAPELDVLGDSKYFSRQKAETQADYFLNDNQRNLQGFKIGAALKIADDNEIKIGGVLSKLNRVASLDLDGKDGSETYWRSPTSGKILGGDFWDYNSYAYVGNIEAKLFKGAIYAGFSYIDAWEDGKSFDATQYAYNDLEFQETLKRLDTATTSLNTNQTAVNTNQKAVDTYTTSLLTDTVGTKKYSTDSLSLISSKSNLATSQGNLATSKVVLGNDNLLLNQDSLRLRFQINKPWDVKIQDFHGGVDVGKFLSTPVIAQLEFDYAMSKKTDGDTLATANLPSQLTGGYYADAIPNTSNSAMLVDGILGYKIDSASLAKIKVSYLNNSKYYLNPLAQSPTFLAERIMNIDGVMNRLQYVNPLDAMYYSVFNYSPAPRVTYDPTLGVTQGYATTQTVSPYQNSTYDKNAYTNTVLFRQNTARMAASGLQEVLPEGWATPDRKGLGLDANFNWQKSVTVKAVYGSYKDSASNSYTQMGFGGHANILQLIGIGDGSIDIGYQTEDGIYNKTTMYQVGADVKVWERVGLLGGYQSLDRNVLANNPWYGNTVNSDVPSNQWMAGVEYEFAKGFYVLVAYGMSHLDASNLQLTNSSGTIIKGDVLNQNITNIKVRANF